YIPCASPQLRNPASAIDDTTLREDISKAVNLIRSGELLQVVFSKRIFIDPIDPFALLRKFTEQDSSLYTYLYSIDGFLAVGSSPEKVVTVIGDEIEINPIAGTRKRGKTVTDDLRLEGELRTDPKELNEHRMLVDLARNDLGKVSKPGSVRVTRSMDLRKYVSVQHLVSTVVGIKKSETSNLDILRAVFPAMGTVSGAPKERAIEIINRFEKFPRGPYAGAIGVVSSNFMDLALSIRTVFGDAQGIYVQSGAGIVKDSIPEREEEEMREKLGSIVGGVTAESTGN
ncbi:MAG: anthranilate synthase component I family protein, partial [Candidatus Thermoplasmatota archaeon]|nr:anthranilate synthase component I family protein [Candidatus Thermoplasmatota archaeon]